MEISRLNAAAPSTLGGLARADVIRPDPEVVRAVAAVDHAKLFGQDNELTFALDRETRRPIIRLVDRRTGKVLRQIPSDQVLRLASNLE